MRPNASLGCGLAVVQLLTRSALSTRPAIAHQLNRCHARSCRGPWSLKRSPLVTSPSARWPALWLWTLACSFVKLFLISLMSGTKLVGSGTQRQECSKEQGERREGGREGWREGGYRQRETNRERERETERKRKRKIKRKRKRKRKRK